jgi:hypothetical protein
VVANEHLSLDKILRLRERTDEFFSLLTLECSHFVILNHIRDPQLLLFMLQFLLFCDQLLSKNLLFVVQVKEDIQVLL